VDPNKHYTGVYFDIQEAEFLPVDWGVENTEKFTSISKKYVKRYLTNYSNNMGRSEKTEKQSVSTIKPYIEDIIAFYFATGSVECSAAHRYETHFHYKKYTGYNNHAVKVKNTDLYVLVWEDKIEGHLSDWASDFRGAEKVADDAHDCPKRILRCTYKWKGLGSRFVSHFKERRKTLVAFN
jgi:hypothetical protein